jgi:hypothetical protein
MHKFAEKLYVKHLSKIINEITEKICRENFDAVFKEKKQSEQMKNTTLGATYDEIEDMACEEISKFLGEQIEDITHEIWKIEPKNKNNPFYNLLEIVWDEFTHYNWIRDIVQEFISCEHAEKQQQLYECGIVDFHGDYTQV